MKITTIGLDLAKSIFQVHGVDATGQVVVRKALRRAQMLPFFAKLPSCLVGIGASDGHLCTFIRFSLGILKSQQPQSPRSEPDGQPIESSQLALEFLGPFYSQTKTAHISNKFRLAIMRLYLRSNADQNPGDGNIRQLAANNSSVRTTADEPGPLIFRLTYDAADMDFAIMDVRSQENACTAGCLNGRIQATGRN